MNYNSQYNSEYGTFIFNSRRITLVVRKEAYYVNETDL